MHLSCDSSMSFPAHWGILSRDVSPLAPWDRQSKMMPEFVPSGYLLIAKQ
jgi:hypothetical protein